jgi:hypothetical protein
LLVAGSGRTGDDVSWDPDILFQKAKLYVARALEAKRGDTLHAFWYHLAFEFVLRSAVASVSPVLLASRRDNPQQSILYALGESADRSRARSASANELVDLCPHIAQFTDDDKRAALRLLFRRNEELHTGAAAFEQLELGEWLEDFFRLSRKLLDRRGLLLNDLFGEQEARVADALLRDRDASTEKLVRDRIQAHKQGWDGLDDETREERIAAARPRTDPLALPDGRLVLVSLKAGLRAPCPACEQPVTIQGDAVGVRDVRLTEDRELIRDLEYLPSALKCAVCGFSMHGHAEFASIGQGAPFSLEETVDPVEFHDVDPMDYFDVNEYMSDMEAHGYQDE